MSSTGQAVGGVVGAVIGFYVGGPSGAYYGAQVGMIAGGLIDPAKVLGPRLDDLTAQTSTYGAFIPRIYGTAPVAGNIFWIQGNALIERTAASSGKGGPAVTNFEYFATFAVSLCEGPIDGVRRIWIGGQLWYDAGSSDIATIIASNESAALFTLYTGTDTQLADPMIQADHGAANVPAYRGLAYIVFNELPVKDYGNSLAGAQVKVEVVRSGAVTGFRVLSEYYELNPYAAQAVMASAYNYQEPYVYYVMPENDSRGGLGLVSIKTIDLLTGLSSAFSVGVSVDGSTWGVGHGHSDSKHYFGTKDQNPGVVFPPFVWENALSSFGEYYSIRDGVYYTIRLNGRMIGCNLAPGLSVLIEYISPIAYSTATSSHLWACETTAAHVYFGVRNMALDLMVLKFNRVTGEFISAAYPPSTIMGISVANDNEIYYPIAYDLHLTTDFFTTNSIVGNHPGVRGQGLGDFGWTVFKVAEGVIVVSAQDAGGIRINLYQYSPTISANLASLSTIVQSECLESDLLTASDIDVTDLTDQVRGYRVSSLAPLRGGIDPLRKAWPFDVIQHGYKIKFKRRGGASVATITSAELDARAAGAAPGVQITNVREMDLVLPNQLTAKYLDAAREYDVNVAEESRQ